MLGATLVSNKRHEDCKQESSAIYTLVRNSFCYWSKSTFLKYLLALNSFRLLSSSAARVFRANQSFAIFALTSFLRATSSVTFWAVTKYVRLSRLSVRNSDEISYCFYSSSLIVALAKLSFLKSSHMQADLCSKSFLSITFCTLSILLMCADRLFSFSPWPLRNILTGPPLCLSNCWHASTSLLY